MKNIKKLLLATTTTLLLSCILAGCGGNNGSSPEVKPSSSTPSTSASEPAKSEQEPVKSESKPIESEQEPIESEHESIESEQEPQPISIESDVSSEQQSATATAIAITSAPKKDHYLVGDSFNPDGLVVTAYYDDGSSEEVTDYTLSAEAPLTLEDNKVTVSWNGFTADIDIVVNIFKHEYNCTESVKDEVYTFASTPTKWAAIKMLPQEALEDMSTAVVAFDVKVADILNNTLYFAGLYGEGGKISHDFKVGAGNSAYVFETEAEDGFYHLEFEYGSAFKEHIDGEGKSTIDFLRIGFVDDNYQAENDMVEGTVSIKNVEVYSSLEVPAVLLSENVLSWNAIEGASKYEIYEHGVKVGETAEPTYEIVKEEDGVYSFAVVAVDETGLIAHSAFSNAVEYVHADSDPDDGTTVSSPINASIAAEGTGYSGEATTNGYRVTYTDVADNTNYGGASFTGIGDLGLTGVTYMEIAFVNYTAKEVKVGVLARDASKNKVNVEGDENKIVHGEGSCFDRLGGSGAYFTLAALRTTVIRFAVSEAPAMVRLMIDCIQRAGGTNSGNVVIKAIGRNVVE